MASSVAQYLSQQGAPLMPEQPTIAIPFDLPDVRVLRTELTKERELIIEVESTLTTALCRRCGQTISAFYGYDRPVLLRHLPSFGYVVYIRLRPKRFRCPFCDDHPTTTQRLEWYEPKALHTKAYERHLLLQLINSTIADVGQKEDITSDALLGIIDRWIASEVDWKTVPEFSVMGVDEIALKKGHRDYVVIVTARCTQGDLHLLAVLPDRRKETLNTWLQSLPTVRRHQLRTVCTDMWEGYVTAIREVLPRVALVIDRFHVARQYRDCADTLRKQELKRLRMELPKDTAKQLKRTLWPFRKRPADLADDEKERLAHLFILAPHQYVIARRLELAKRLLLTSTHTVAEIAWSIGYENMSHFRRLFTMHIGMTPGEIRRAGIQQADKRKNRPSAA